MTYSHNNRYADNFAFILETDQLSCRNRKESKETHRMSDKHDDTRVPILAEI